jgi:DNA-binding IclR family transcriptional regulator
MKSFVDPAPALTRGLAVIKQLAVEGQSTLEQLALRGRWPKSSTRRYLLALERAGVVRQDPSSKVWHLQQHLVAFHPVHGDPLASWRSRLGRLARDFGQCVEMYRVGADGVVLEDRADPVIRDIQIAARIGFRRDLGECDATALVVFAFSGREAGGKAPAWRWKGGRRAPVMRVERERLLGAVVREGVAVDGEFNEHGIRRFAVGLFDDTGGLAGILAVAQRQTPLSARQTSGILKILKTLRGETPAVHSTQRGKAANQTP